MQKREKYRFNCPVLMGREQRGMLTGASEYDGASFTHLHTRKVDELVLADHDLLYELAAAKLYCLRLVKGRCNFPACSRPENLAMEQLCGEGNPAFPGLGKISAVYPSAECPAGD